MTAKRGWPALLALAGSIFFFLPSRTQLVGWGEDPAFNLWTFENVWRNLTRWGPTAIFSDRFWDTNIFYPQKLTLALSENQIWPALLSWPIRHVSRNGVFTLGVTAWLMCLAAFLFACLWLKERGLERTYVWGGLFFALCGWLQSQCAHFQNICIFVFPLALWRWERFRSKPDARRLVLCAASFGWIIGWNAYFQVFANLILCLLIGRALFAGSGDRKKLFLLLALGLAFEMPLAWKYFELQRRFGGLGVSNAEIQSYAAQFWSFWQHAGTRSLAQRWVPFYPHPSGGVESVGFLGFTWIFLMAAAGAKKETRFEWILCALFFGVALGPKWGLSGVVKLFPGFAALRAIGRIQILVLLFSLPVVMNYLEHASGRARWAGLGLVLVELLPGQPPIRLQVPESFFGDPSAFSAAVDARLPAGAPLLMWSPISSRVQLYSLQTRHPLFGGYSGRSFANWDELVGFKERRGPRDPAAVREAAEFTGAKWIASVDEAENGFLAALPFLRSTGCFEHFGMKACLFEVVGPSGATARLNLAGDAHWEPREAGGVWDLRLIADRAGELSYAELGDCSLRQTARMPSGRAVFTRSRRLKLLPLTSFHVAAGEELAQESYKQFVYRGTGPLRLTPSLETRCGAPSAP